MDRWSGGAPASPLRLGQGEKTGYLRRNTHGDQTQIAAQRRRRSARTTPAARVAATQLDLADLHRQRRSAQSSLVSGRAGILRVGALGGGWPAPGRDAKAGNS